MRKTRLGSTKGVRLYSQDEQALISKVKSKEYKDMAEAIRTCVSKHLSQQRLKVFNADYEHEAIKNTQKEVLRGVENKLDNNTNNLEEIKEALALVIKNQEKDSQTKNSNPQTEFEQIIQQVNKLTLLIQKSNSSIYETQIQQFLMQGMLTFFAIGFHAEKIKPIKMMQQNEFAGKLKQATNTTMQSAKKSIEENPNAKLEEVYVMKFAQNLFDLFYPKE